MTDTVVEDHVVSRDGTRIGFWRRGSGPGVVLISAAMQTAYNYDELSQALAESFTVYSPDRRGRGMSPKDYDPAHTIARDVEDVDAICATTGTTLIFGLSSGAMIALEAARTLPRIERAVIYEPPFYPDGMNHEGVRQLNTQVEQGNLAAAMATALLVTEMLPTPMRILPYFVLRLLAQVALFFDDRKSSPYAKLRSLIPGIRYDFNDVAGMDGKIESLASLDKPVLLISGKRTLEFLQVSCRQLKTIIPRSEHLELEGFDHSGPWNGSGGGDPAVLAIAMHDFFLDSHEAI